MSHPATPETWIDPHRPTGAPQPAPTDAIDRALDALAETIARADNDGQKRALDYLTRPPGLTKAASALAQLSPSRLAAFLDRNQTRASVPRALLPGATASRRADRIARAQIFLRITTPERLIALKRACDKVSHGPAGACP